MDKENANPIVHDAVGSKRDASLFDVVPSMAVAVGASEAAASGSQIPTGWDPYEEVSYEAPPNPYDTFMDDPWNEVTTVCSLFCSPFLFEPYFCWFPCNY
jgi:hypothetical protein